MSQGLNRVMLMGNLGVDPELRHTQAGQAVLNVRLATTESYLDQDKVRRERTDWHNVVVWGPRGEALARILNKGSSIFVEGSLRTSSYDNRDGNKRYKTEVIAREVLFAGGRQHETWEEGDHADSGSALADGGEGAAPEGADARPAGAGARSASAPSPVPTASRAGGARAASGAAAGAESGDHPRSRSASGDAHRNAAPSDDYAGGGGVDDDIRSEHRLRARRLDDSSRGAGVLRAGSYSGPHGDHCTSALAGPLSL